MSKKKRVPAKFRTGARQRALQALYQWGMVQQSSKTIEEQFVTDQDMSEVDLDYFSELVNEIPKISDELETLYKAFLDRPEDQLDPIEVAILRISVYELAHRIDVPYKAVINEAVELAKDYGADESHKYINGILDKVVERIPLRVAEIGRRKKRPKPITPKRTMVPIKSKKAKITVKEKSDTDTDKVVSSKKDANSKKEYGSDKRYAKSREKILEKK